MKENLDHSVRLHFPYAFDSTASPEDYQLFNQKISQLSIEGFANSAPFVSTSSDLKFYQSKLWRPEKVKLDNRIHPFADKLINGVQDNAINSKGFFGMQPLKLSEEAIKLLNGGSATELGKGLAISLNSEALKRLKSKEIYPPLKNNSWPLMFNSICFYGFNTGVGVLVIDLSFKQPGKNRIGIKRIEELQEINYIICRKSYNHQCGVIAWKDSISETLADEIETKQFNTQGLSSLVASLIPTDMGKTIRLKPTGNHSDVYAYTFLATHQGLDREQRKNYIFRLARKYHELYLPEKIDEQIGYFEPFKPVTHAFCLEGAVTYVDFICCGNDIPESIKNFNTDAIPYAYAPLVLLTYAEYIFLREIATNTPDNEKVDMRNPTTDNLEKLRSFRTKLYDFGLNFRYSQISNNTNHNLFCNANKKAFEIKELLDEASSDTQEIEQYIADQVGQKQTARLKKFGLLGSLFAVTIGWVDLWGLNLHSIIFEKNSANPTSIAIFFTVLFVLAIIIFYSSRDSTDKKNGKM